jgi:hypothetical protein
MICCSMHLPEPFLWHVFYHLIQGCGNFEEGPFKSLYSDEFGEELMGGYLLHSDIKLDNSTCFLECRRSTKLTH